VLGQEVSVDTLIAPLLYNLLGDNYAVSTSESFAVGASILSAQVGAVDSGTAIVYRSVTVSSDNHF
jgi:hypothetical protein